MALIDWFKRLAGGGAPETGEAVVPGEERNAEIAGLNFMTAIEAHIKWKARLEGYIDGTTGEELKVEVVSRDDQCPLGQWIYGPGGERYQAVDAFGEMKQSHADFHRCAGKVLATAQAGERDAALNLLQRGDYVRASEKVKMQLARLYVLLDERRRANPGS